MSDLLQWLIGLGAGGAVGIIIKSLLERDNRAVEVTKGLLEFLTTQSEALRKENKQLMQDMATLRIDLNKELDDERRSCAEAMRLMSDNFNERIRELENLVNNKK
jgi:hypothetical protein